MRFRKTRTCQVQLRAVKGRQRVLAGVSATTSHPTPKKSSCQPLLRSKGGTRCTDLTMRPSVMESCSCTRGTRPKESLCSSPSENGSDHKWTLFSSVDSSNSGIMTARTQLPVATRSTSVFRHELPKSTSTGSCKCRADAGTTNLAEDWQ
jgi:hypothetical protein